MELKNRIRRILPIAVNFEIKNMKDYFYQEEIIIPEGIGPRVFFCDAATYNNLGDQAIAYAMKCYLTDLVGEQSYIEIPQSKIVNSWKSLLKNVKPYDIICLSGGGNMGDLYPRFEAIRRKIIRAFPDNKIIIFPQTIDYSKTRYGMKELKRSSDIYNRHNHLLICAREQQSYFKMRELYNNVILVPDIVMYIKDRLQLSERKSIRDFGICLRNDSESCLSPVEKEEIQEILNNKGKSFKLLSTMCNSNDYFLNNEQRLKVIIDKINEFRNCNCVITDRLHGMIFSYLANVPCIVFDNSNHKVFGVLDVIGVENKGIIKANFPSDISKIIEEVVDMTNERTQIDYDVIKNYIFGGTNE